MHQRTTSVILWLWLSSWINYSYVCRTEAFVSPGADHRRYVQLISMSTSPDNDRSNDVKSSTNNSINPPARATQDPQPQESLDQKNSGPTKQSSMIQDGTIPNNSSISPQLLMRSLNTSPRRLFIGTLSASAIALTGNFGGITSFLLAALPEETVEKSGLDQYFPRGNYKRYKSEFGYTFVVPKEWVQDTALELAKVQRRSGSLDYSMTPNRLLRTGGELTDERTISNRPRSLPDVAFGPPGYNPDKFYMQSGPNVSVAVTKVRPGQTLRASFGSPRNAAETLLRVTIAPEGSGKVATLRSASEEVRGAGQIYTFEYEVDRGEKGIPARAISNIAVQQEGTVITMTVVAPKKEWEAGGEFEKKLRKMAESFKLTVA